MSKFEQNYTSLVDIVLLTGEARSSRAGPTRSLFGIKLKITSLSEGFFPILTARKMFYRPVLGELAAFLKGATRLATFKKFGCNYWDANADAWVENAGLPVESHDVGQIYGAQWRNWQNKGHDQLKELIKNLKENPLSRRHMLTTYDPSESHMCLPPCHLLAQFNVTNEQRLDCIVYMRSVDLCLGLPSDIILYAALMLIICQQVNLRPGNLTFMLGDTHIYENHVLTWHTQAAAKFHPLPMYLLDQYASIDSFTPGHLTLINYQHGAKLEYPFNV